MIVSEPSKRAQTATAAPLPSTATCGSVASRPGAERLAGTSQAGWAAAGAAAANSPRTISAIAAGSRIWTLASAGLIRRL